jgi:hypothetical protein
MAYVTPSSMNVKGCFSSHYSLPYFQRDYKWEVKHYTEMLNDIQNVFLLDHDITHGRKHVAGYKPYFLGSIITATEKDGKRPLIDGQQRLTSVFLLLAYLERFRKDQGIADAADLKKLLGSFNYGAMDYSIEFSPVRRSLFDEYLQDGLPHMEAMKKVEDLAGLDDSDMRILAALRATDKELDVQVRDRLAFFIDYLIEKVFLIDISVASEAEAHQVFVTMNDRGLRLGPIDLLKGKILSQIPNAGDSELCHANWTDAMLKLRNRDPEEDSLFFRNLLRAKWAISIRGKNKGDAAGDFDVIGDAYHRWFEANSAKLGINGSDDYLKFARDSVPFYATVYDFIRSAEETFQPGFEHIYFNAARKYTLQPMVLLSSVQDTDSDPQWKKKIQLVSRYLDLILTARTVEGKENNYDNLRDLSFTLTKEIRDKTVLELEQLIRAEWDKHLLLLLDISKMKYSFSDRSDLLYVLARIADHLERSFEQQNKLGFPAYWIRDKAGKTYDIEHLLKKNFDPTTLPAVHGFADAAEYLDERNRLGSLILLPRSRNRSLQDKIYTDKLPTYATENVLAQVLCAGFYQNNPKVTAYFSVRPGLLIAPVNAYGKSDIANRGKFYSDLAQEIWRKI